MATPTGLIIICPGCGETAKMTRRSANASSFVCEDCKAKQAARAS